MTEEKKDEVKEEKKEEEKEIEVPKKFKDIVEEIEKMSVLDLSELVKILEEKFGVSAVPTAVAGFASAGDSGEAGASEEKSSFNVQLTSVGDKKIEVIKVVRDLIGKGLKEAKDLVDSAVTEPQMIKEGALKEEAEEMKKKFEAAGASVELK
ncbi:MAG: 50S ribosomal protein L7/L12 [Candidatus Nealsonbacteria bacterium]